MSGYTHCYHMVDVRPWPLLAGGGGLGLTIGAVEYF